jgi:hypothetical protein
MAHLLETSYGLTATEILDAVSKRFRLRAALEGAVAEVHMDRQIALLVANEIERYESHDIDGHPDFSIWLPRRDTPLRAECKTVRDSEEAYRSKGQIVAYKVETQKTRVAKGDPTSRLYGVDQFEILGVCLGKKTGDWTQFLYVRTADLMRHTGHKHKLTAMQRVPLPDGENIRPWYSNLGELLREYYLRQ